MPILLHQEYLLFCLFHTSSILFNFLQSLPLSVSFIQATDIPFNLVSFINQSVNAVFCSESSSVVYKYI